MFKYFLQFWVALVLAGFSLVSFGQDTATSPTKTNPLPSKDFKQAVTDKGKANKAKLDQQVAEILAKKGPVSKASRSADGTPAAPQPAAAPATAPAFPPAPASPAPDNYTGFQGDSSSSSSGSQSSSGLDIQY
jgi:hypothetical protein